MKYQPMLAEATTRQGNRAPINPHDLRPDTWLFQPKYDGIRLIAEYDNRQPLAIDGWRLWTRQGNLLAPKPHVVVDLFAVPQHSLVLDGELVANSFTELAPWAKAPTSRARPPGLRYVAFDLLEYAGEDLTGVAQEMRLEMLSHISSNWHVAAVTTYADAMNQSAEGVVAKRRNARYQQGVRSRDWLKFKRETTLTVIAYECSRDGKRSLSVAVRMHSGRALQIGTVGSGISDRTWETFATPNALPCVIEITAAGRSTTGLRFPVFKRIRTDLHPHDITDREYLSLSEF